MIIFAWGNICIYLVAELLAGAVATGIFRCLHPGQ
jgi:hypothetical protein